MSNQPPQIEYVVRVALPSSSGYHSGPSGDTEYDADYKNAIHAAVPPGFEVAWKSRDTWPKDKDGLTWVRLYCVDQKRAVEYYAERMSQMMQKVQSMQQIARQLVNA